jgi:DNA-binding CsgD family transcriptional regulator
MTHPGYTLDRDDSGLTAQEREVANSLARHVSQAQIARELGISRERVRQIRQQLIAKGYEVGGGRKK